MTTQMDGQMSRRQDAGAPIHSALLTHHWTRMAMAHAIISMQTTMGMMSTTSSMPSLLRYVPAQTETWTACPINSPSQVARHHCSLTQTMTMMVSSTPMMWIPWTPTWGAIQMETVSQIGLPVMPPRDTIRTQMMTTTACWMSMMHSHSCQQSP